MNIAVSITALFSGIFIVVIGSLADRFDRVKMRSMRVSHASRWPIKERGQ